MLVLRHFEYPFFPSDMFSVLQLFQNILASTELQFPQEALNELHLDCLDLCRRLLRQNPGIDCNCMVYVSVQCLFGCMDACMCKVDQSEVK